VTSSVEVRAGTSCTLWPDALEVGWRWGLGVRDVFDVQVKK